MRVLQVTVQMEVDGPESEVRAVKDFASDTILRSIIDVGEQCVVVGFACEEIDPEENYSGDPLEAVGHALRHGAQASVTEFPVGVPHRLMTDPRTGERVEVPVLRDVATPRGPVPPPTDDELRAARDEHPQVIGLVGEGEDTDGDD